MKFIREKVKVWFLRIPSGFINDRIVKRRQNFGDTTSIKKGVGGKSRKISRGVG